MDTNEHALSSADARPVFPDLAGRVAVVTGGSRGIGAGTCRALAANGAKVAVVARGAPAVEALAADIRAHGGVAIGVAADCADVDAVEAMRARVEAELGPADVLMAFAGGSGEPVPTLELTEAQWRAVLDANLTSTFLTVQSFLRGMVERGRGSVVTMASAAARLPAQSSMPYAAAKAGIIQLTRHLANEMGPRGVRLNCVSPSAIMTEKMDERMPPAVREPLAASFPLRRIGRVDDVAHAALFLASDASSWITGVTLDVAGGKVMI
ncbi:MAG: short-chain dehydrogenase/reductase [Gemmatimonadetes bacterium]|nr:short-chain dehydrogenase/reductase [Gemmatimonadota bacterium]